MKKEIQSCFTWYATTIAHPVQYESWSDEFCRKEVKRYTNHFLKELKKYIDWDNLTKEEAAELRFCKWSDDSPNLYLIPLYLLPILPLGTKLTTIFGEEVVYDGNNVDNDTRSGCIAYGIEITK